ncbi:MAG: glycerophosphodiester phosphodiesterase [Staphylococcus haemolyticus]|nr:glycerophosphodiester phosphodiesterase [Staphylococcus haemolyticus]MCE4955494.1 glycerophosphodiester phosphodiesterase [Staphylococcus haemolyticus]UVD88503.1 glycerophosphodiester phosphodiesterase [Staphylococcus haemolyticus]WAI21212.1 MAG: glycerophosphodiester phosphodiesterase [Staphylococcus haemolyticus]WAI22379.1 MAG: glycerophosphodiester phosphodiesterase [Staphylococcus haemolyticus]
MSLLKASNKGIISCLTVASLSLAIIHTPVEASGGESSNTTTTNLTNASKTQNNHTNWSRNLTGERHTTIAHRGASGYAPEHTFAAYDKSHNELGASYIEIDLQRTKDGHLVAMHDETVDRTTNGSGRVEDYTLAELKKLDAGSSFNEQNPQLAKDSYKGATVPTLDEILSRYGTNANYYIETKQPDVYPGMEQQLLDTLNRHNMLTSNSLENGHVLVQSFSEASLLKMHQLNSNVPLIRLLDKGELAQQSQADLQRIRSYATGVGPEYSDLNAQNTAHLKDLGFLVHPFTVNETADMQRLNQYGVDGVFTNYADQYKAISAQK